MFSSVSLDPAATARGSDTSHHRGPQPCSPALLYCHAAPRLMYQWYLLPTAHAVGYRSSAAPRLATGIGF